jgi:hypothetical protein
LSVFVVDISNWQQNVDMSPWKAAGIQGCIAKALEGMTGVDAKWYQNKAKMLAWGGVPGAYHYLNNIHTGAEQCNAFLDLVPGNFIHALDVEGPGIGLQRVDDWFAAYRRRYPHKTVWLYTNYGMWTQVSKIPGSVNAPARWGPVVIWVAGAYAGAYQPGTDDFRKIWARVPAGCDGGLPFLGFDEYAAMQYTGSADVPGVPTPCDMSIFGGTAAGLRAYTGTGAVDDMSQADVDAINKHIDDAFRANYDEIGAAAAKALLSSNLGSSGPNVAVALQSGFQLAQKIQAQTDTLEASAAAEAASDAALQTALDTLNAKVGSGGAGQLTKADLLEALGAIRLTTDPAP